MRRDLCAAAVTRAQTHAHTHPDTNTHTHTHIHAHLSWDLYMAAVIHTPTYTRTYSLYTHTHLHTHRSGSMRGSCHTHTDTYSTTLSPTHAHTRTRTHRSGSMHASCHTHTLTHSQVSLTFTLSYSLSHTHTIIAHWRRLGSTRGSCHIPTRLKKRVCPWVFACIVLSLCEETSAFSLLFFPLESAISILFFGDI